jgi:hypothetical protein
MMICIRHWISKTQHKSKENRTGTLSGKKSENWYYLSRNEGATYPSGIFPSKKSHPIMPIATFEAISSHTRIKYVLLNGDLIATVCLIAFHTVRKPKPKVNPAAIPATVKSRVLLLAMAYYELGHIQ